MEDFVLKKIQTHPFFVRDKRDKQRQLALEFSNHRQIKDKFSHLLNIDEQIDAALEEGNVEYVHSLERDNARIRQKHEVAQACNLPVKLILSKLGRGTPPLAGPFTKMLRFKYGPLHAGLIVGNVCIEWDDSSLVVPQIELARGRGEFEGFCHEGSQWGKKIGELVKDMSLANRMNSDIPTKLEILYRSRSEKEKLIDNLVKVIVKYNTKDKYNIWSCNCQHFVIDAMDALGIKNQPKFKGRLGDYLQQLKHGKNLVDFNSHEELDKHILSSISSMDTGDKEYFLCLYFQFHLPVLKDLDLDHQDQWKCPISTCQCSRLEAMVVEESLLFHQFMAPRAQQPSRPVVAKPSPALPGIKKAVNGGDEFPYHKFMNRRESEDEHRTQLAQCSGYSDRIISKLERHHKYSKFNSQERLKLSEELSEKEQFRKRYLEKLIDDISVDIVCQASDDCDHSSVMTSDLMRRRSVERFQKLLNPNIRLVYLYQGCAEDGDILIRTALQVGGHVYEWNETSLVIPGELEHVLSKPLLHSSILQQSKWGSIAREKRSKIEQSIENYPVQIDLYYEFTEKKDEFLLDFVTTVLDFNRNKNYDPSSCNQLNFLTDSLRSLGIGDVPDFFHTTLNQYIYCIKLTSYSVLRGREFTNHQQLDEFVQQFSSKFTKSDVEFLLAKYFQFHIHKLEGARVYVGKWVCPYRNCKLGCLEELLEKQVLV